MIEIIVSGLVWTCVILIGTLFLYVGINGDKLMAEYKKEQREKQQNG